MKNYVVHYCAITEDTGLLVRSIEAHDFVAAAALAVEMTPENMKVYLLEEEAGQ